MTTILVTPDVIAHDARGTSPGGMVISNEIGKSIGYKGDVYVGVGNAAVFLAIMYHVVTGKPHPRWKIDGSGFVVISRADGTVETLSAQETPQGMSLGFSPIVASPIAFGSGTPWALAATDMGKSPVDALEYAMERDTCSGGEITVLQRHRKDDPLEDYNLEWLVGGNLRTLMDIKSIKADEHSMEDFDGVGLYQPDCLFQLGDLALNFKHHPSKIAKYVSHLSDRILGPFESVAANWGFQVSGDIGQLHKLAKSKDYMDWAPLSFYKPQGMKVDLVTYQKALLGVVSEMTNIREDIVKPLSSFTRRAIGNLGNLQRVSKDLDSVNIEVGKYRKPITDVLDREDPTNRCRVDELVKNNKEWENVEKSFSLLVREFDKVGGNKLLMESRELAKELVELSEICKDKDDITSVVGAANYKTLVEHVEALAFILDSVGVMGYLIQQLETSLRRNSDLMASS